MKHSDQVILQKIIYYCNEIDMLMNRFGKSQEAYEQDRAYQYAVSTCIVQIGELVARLTEETLAANDSIPWRAIRGMRNIYVHDYEKTKYKTIWQTMTEDIPALRRQLLELLDQDKES